jgi:hypothetical protein
MASTGGLVRGYFTVRLFNSAIFLFNNEFPLGRSLGDCLKALDIKDSQVKA